MNILKLDLSGNSIDNRIIGEEHSLIASDLKYRIIRPRNGAFFHNSSLDLRLNNQALTKGTDYETIMLDDELTLLCGKSIYKAIRILNSTLTGVLYVNYQAVGGPDSINIPELKENVDGIDVNASKVNYKDIINKPTGYNPMDHYDELWQLYGAENIITVLDRLKVLIENTDSAVVEAHSTYAIGYQNLGRQRLDQEINKFETHIADYNNPHGDTKHDLNLGHMNDWPMATAEEHRLGIRNDRYVNSSGVHSAIESNLNVPLRSHTSDYGNPHGTEAGDINAYTTSEEDALLVTRLNVNQTAVNSNKLYGRTLANLKTEFQQDIPGNTIQSGLFKDTVIAGGNPTQTTVLRGDGNWVETQELIDAIMANHTRSNYKVIPRSVAGNFVAAINYANANFLDLETYPYGTYALYNCVDSGGYSHPGVAASPYPITPHTYFVQPLIRTYSGWKWALITNSL